MTSPESATTESDIPLGGALTFALLNHAGRAELNLPDSPQSLLLVITNRSALPVAISPGSTILLQFRPVTLRHIERIALAHDSVRMWALQCDNVNNMVTITADADHVLAPGGSLSIHLSGVAAARSGGTRATRVRVEYWQFGSPDAERIGHQLVHLAIRRSPTDGPDLARVVGAGSVCTVGPFTAGFTNGAAALNQGESLNELHVRILNSSGRPVRLSGDDDASTRLVIDYLVADGESPWGLMAEHGDHLGVTEPDGWTLEATTLRRASDWIWSAGHPIDLVLQLHTSAPTHQAQLMLRFENLLDYDDTELVLLVELGPFAIHNDRTTTANPLEFLGAEAQIDFSLAEAAGDTDSATRASLKAVSGGALRLAAAWLELVEGAESRWMNADVPEVDKALLPSLSISVKDYAAHLQSANGVLRLNPLGSGVIIGEGLTGYTTNTPLTVSGSMKVTSSAEDDATSLYVDADSRRAAISISLGKPLWIDSSEGVGISLLPDVMPDPQSALTVGGALVLQADAHSRTMPLTASSPLFDAAPRLIAGVTNTHPWIQGQGNGALLINPVGGSVCVGGAPNMDNSTLFVLGWADIVDQLRAPPSYSLAIRTADISQTQLRLGISSEFGFIDTQSRPLRLNPGGSSVGVGNIGALASSAALTVGGWVEIVDQFRDAAGGYSLGIRTADIFETQLRFGISSEFGFIQTSAKPLKINPAGGNLVIFNLADVRFRNGDKLLKMRLHTYHYNMSLGDDIDFAFINLEPTDEAVP